MSGAIDSLGTSKLVERVFFISWSQQGQIHPCKWIAESNFFRSALSLKGAGNNFQDLLDWAHPVNQWQCQSQYSPSP